MSVSTQQHHWRACKNDAVTPTQFWAAEENTDGVLLTGSDLVRFRVILQNPGGSEFFTNLALQFSINNSTWNPLGPGRHWNWADGLETNNASVTATVLSGSPSKRTVCEVGTNSPSVGATGLAYEFEFCIQPTTYATAGTRYYFKVSCDAGDFTLATGHAHPQISTAAGATPLTGTHPLTYGAGLAIVQARQLSYGAGLAVSADRPLSYGAGLAISAGRPLSYGAGQAVSQDRPISYGAGQVISIDRPFSYGVDAAPVDLSKDHQLSYGAGLAIVQARQLSYGAGQAISEGRPFSYGVDAAPPKPTFDLATVADELTDVAQMADKNIFVSAVGAQSLRRVANTRRGRLLGEALEAGMWAMGALVEDVEAPAEAGEVDGVVALLPQGLALAIAGTVIKDNVTTVGLQLWEYSDGVWGLAATGVGSLAPGGDWRSIRMYYVRGAVYVLCGGKCLIRRGTSLWQVPDPQRTWTDMMGGYPGGATDGGFWRAEWWTGALWESGTEVVTLPSRNVAEVTPRLPYATNINDGYPTARLLSGDARGLNSWGVRHYAMGGVSYQNPGADMGFWLRYCPGRVAVVEDMAVAIHAGHMTGERHWLLGRPLAASGDRGENPPMDGNAGLGLYLVETDLGSGHGLAITETRVYAGSGDDGTGGGEGSGTERPVITETRVLASGGEGSGTARPVVRETRVYSTGRGFLGGDGTGGGGAPDDWKVRYYLEDGSDEERAEAVILIVGALQADLGTYRAAVRVDLEEIGKDVWASYEALQVGMPHLLTKAGSVVRVALFAPVGTSWPNAQVVTRRFPS